MTTKPLLLNQNLFSFSYSSLFLVTGSTVFLPIACSGFAFLALSQPGQAQNAPIITEQLPPPPTPSPRSRSRNRLGNMRQPTIEPPTYSEVNSSDDNSDDGEYTFSAPQSGYSYRVEVFGTSETLLSEVRRIEPRAFRKGDVIQAGIFSDQQNAEDLVRQLTMQGFWARVIVSQ